MPVAEPAFLAVLVLAVASTTGCCVLLRAYRRRVGALKRELDEKEARSRETVQTILDGKERIEAIVSGMFEGVIVIEPDGKVLLMNPAFAKLFGTLELDPAGRNYWEIFRQETIHTLIRKALVDEVPVSGDYDILVPEEKHFQVQISPIRNRENFLGIVVILHDVTNIRRLERMRSEFVANVSHELKTPLSSIIGAADTLRGGALDDAEHRVGFVEMIRRHAGELKNLIDDLLDLARIESTGSKIEKSDIRAADLFDDLGRNFAPLAKKKGVQLVFGDSSGGPARVHRAKILQALSNLVENALKYTDSGGSVAVEASTDGAWGVFTVSDTGIGIAEEDQKRVFERFYRTEKSRSRDAGGTGLGLSIVKHIAEAHGGSVEVRNRPGGGSIFRVRVPHTA